MEKSTELQVKSQASPLLRQVSQNVTVQKIQNRTPDQIPTPKTVAEAVANGSPLMMILKVTDQESVLYALEYELTLTMSRVNIDARLNLQAHQTRIIAETILENFKHESIEDFKLAFARGAAGFYGQIYRLDGAVLTGWIQAYLEEKYSFIEQQFGRQKARLEKETGVDYKAFQERLSAERVKLDSAQKEAHDRKKALAERVMAGQESLDGYKPLTAEEIAAKYGYDPMTGKKPEKATQGTSAFSEKELQPKGE